MTAKLTIAKVGGGEIDLTGFTGRKGTPFFDGDQALVKLGMRFANGEAHQGEFKVMDPDAELPRADFTYNLPAHKLVTLTEDAPGPEIWLSRGWTSQYDGGRGTVAVDNQVEFDVQVLDGNMELREQAFTVPWVRPAETGVARLIALQAYTLNGASSTAAHSRDTCEVTVSTSHLCPNTNLVTMPAKTYPAGTQPQDVVTDCAETENKVYGVEIHHVGGSHLCLEYILETDHTTYLSPVKISDNLADWDPTDLTAPVYEPHWEAGKATQYDGEQLLSGLVSIYGDNQSVFVENAGNITAYGYAVESFYDSQSETPAQATARAASLLEYRGKTHITHRVSIIMLPEQLDLVTAGMSLQIKAAAALGGELLDIYQTRRIAEHQFEPRIDGTYWAHLTLDRAQKRGPYSAGKTQPRATTPRNDPVGGTAEICTDDITIVEDWYGYGHVEVNPPFTTTLFNGDDDGELTGTVITVDVDTTAGHTIGIAFVGGAPSLGVYTFTPGASGGYFSGRFALPALPAGTEQAILFESLAAGAPADGTNPTLHLVRNTAGRTSLRVTTDLGTSATYDLAIDTDLDAVVRFKLGLVDLNVLGKVWVVGDPEPDWQVATTQTSNPVNTRLHVNFVTSTVPAVVSTVMDEVQWVAQDCVDVPTGYHGMHYGPVLIATADGSTSTFTLPVYPGGGYVPGTLDARINGIYQPAGVVDADAGTFDFAYDPDAGDIISASWRVPL